MNSNSLRLLAGLGITSLFIVGLLQAIDRPSNSISAIVVPHHNLVQKQRETLFETIAPRVSPKTIILISPNHYESGQASIQTTTQTWDITDGTIQPNQSVIQRLLQSNSVKEEPKSFVNEHGIKLILGDIKHFFPKADIVPLILKMDTSEEEITQTQKILKKYCVNCLLVASVDFSHYQPALLAELHDSLTLRALNDLDDSQLLTKAEVDSPAALSLLGKWARSHNANHFVLQDHTNAGIIVHDPDVETTTHLFGWYERGLQTKNIPSVSFTLGGSLQFEHLNNTQSSSTTATQTFFSQLGNRTFWGTDASLLYQINTTNEPSDTFKKAAMYLRATFIDPAASQSDVTTVKGADSTLSIIKPIITNNSSDILSTIKSLKAQRHHIVIYPYWPDQATEQHTQRQEQLAHSWIDAGADAVIGTNGKTIQDTELYNQAPIVYSVGQFINQTDTATTTPSSLIIAGQFYDNELQLFALPTQTVNGKPLLLRGNEKAIAIKKFSLPFQQQQRSTPSGAMFVFPEK